jgi:DNA-binding LytR/AlgR family response regulator
MSYPCLIIDDEPLARKVLLNYVAKVSELGPVMEFENAEDALTYISQNPVPLVFLDIKMPEISGLELAPMLPKSTEIIFTTAYSQHAVDGFNLEALDYLMKPIPYPRFLQAIRRFLDKMKPTDLKGGDDWISIKDGSHVHKIMLNDILYFEGMKDYVKIFTPGKSYIQHQTLKNLEAILPKDYFIRVHRSYIVNLHKIKSYYASDLVLGEAKIPVGPGYKDQVGSLLASKSISKS